MFSGWLSISQKCNNCGLELGKSDLGDAAIFFAMSIACISVAVIAVLVDYYLSWSLWLHLVVWTIVVALMSLGLLRIFRGLFIALNYRKQL